ncbi:MAG TPA: MmgE/PrpD family protein [Xanthobacteraceae bacterium]|nr:MmgE/PrpD family protein [Xanthobacteraceae bacterium]HUN95654.1 MmgE/PrpD family protein [Bradyrhizobium sp.]
MSSLTLDLGQFVADLSLRQIPSEGCAIARTGIADCFGVLIAGARDPEVDLVDRELGSSGDGAAQASYASLIPSGARRSLESAALINGVAAHVLDYDDVSLDGHPSAVLVPAILAQGEASGASGAEMLAAYIAGFEVWAELLAREPTPLHRKGWHPSAVLGTVAAAAASAKLRRLDGPGAATAMAIAASMSSGLVANFGTMTKSFQVGRAAQSGVIAARLAQAGLTASPDALEHRCGLLVALSPEGNAELDRPFTAAQKEWHIVGEGLNIKRYPICYATHRSIDAALGLVERHNLSANDVDRIHVSTGKTQLLMLRNSRPQTGLEAKFSMQFAMAAALVARRVGLSELTDAFVRRPEVQAIFPHVSFATTDATMEGSAFAPADSVEITTKGGETFKSGPVEHAKGSHQRPLSRGELFDKFTDCLGAEFQDSKKSRAFENLMIFDRLNGAGDLMLQS